MEAIVDREDSSATESVGGGLSLRIHKTVATIYRSISELASRTASCDQAKTTTASSNQDRKSDMPQVRSLRRHKTSTHSIDYLRHKRWTTKTDYKWSTK
jgi:hypothetical protein